MSKIPFKSFLETVKQRLDSFSPGQLREILMNMALQAPSSERQEFLDKLTIPEDEVVEQRITAHQENLSDDIEYFIEQLESSMAESEYESHRGYEYYDDEDTLGPYEGYVHQLEELFDKTNAAFDYGKLELARDAYKKLFSVFELEDDYGRGIGRYDTNNVDMKEIVARYLRSVYETTSCDKRPQLLFDEMQNVLSIVQDRIGLEDLMQITTNPLPDEEQFLDNWTSFLRKQDDKAADYWLREAIKLAKGTEGLKELALSEGQKRPRAFLDWVSALMGTQKYRDVIAAVKKARQVLPPDLPIRAAIADYLRKAAQHVGDNQLASTAIWEAFYAKPNVSRLLDVWEDTPDDSERIKLMQQASERIKVYLPKRLPFSLSVYRLDNDDAERYARVTKSTLAHAYLLCRDWESAYKMSLADNQLGWSSSENPQGLVVICFLGLSSKRMPGNFPPNLALLWDEALKDSLDFGEQETILPRLKEAYEKMFSKANLVSKEDTLLRWSLKTSRKRATSIVSNQYRKSYWKAASLITACSEVLGLQGKEQEAGSLISEIRSQFPRHRSFQAELRKAIARR